MMCPERNSGGVESVDHAKPQALSWTVGGDRALSLDQPRIVRILNITPDSFSDGGLYINPEAAAGRAMEMVSEGACVIDIGGESTRPGARRVDATEQIGRVVPVIEKIREESDVLISIDTTLSEVARAAIDAGANIINDVSAGDDDEKIFEQAVQHRCGLILMHRLRKPAGDSYSDQYQSPPEYDDVVATVGEFLRERAAKAEAAGVDRASIVIDPGLGFGKTVEQNYELIRRTNELLRIGYPLLSAASRKSFIGKVTNEEEPAKRVMGSVAVSVAHYLSGVRLFRVHDVAAHRQALAVAAAICNCQTGS